MKQPQKFSTKIPQTAPSEQKAGMFLLQENCSGKLTGFSFSFSGENVRNNYIFQLAFQDDFESIEMPPTNIR